MNRAPIDSTWTGKDVNGELITVIVKSDPIPGNELRQCQLISSHNGDEAVFIGTKWFRSATRLVAERGEAVRL